MEEPNWRRRGSNRARESRCTATEIWKRERDRNPEDRMITLSHLSEDHFSALLQAAPLQAGEGIRLTVRHEVFHDELVLGHLRWQPHPVLEMRDGRKHEPAEDDEDDTASCIPGNGHENPHSLPILGIVTVARRHTVMVRFRSGAGTRDGLDRLRFRRYHVGHLAAARRMVMQEHEERVVEEFVDTRRSLPGGRKTRAGTLQMVAERLGEDQLHRVRRVGRVVAQLRDLGGTRHRTQRRLRIRDAASAGCQVVFDDLPHSIEPRQLLLATTDAVHPLGAKITNGATLPTGKRNLTAEWAHC